MKVVVAGCRDFYDYEKVKETLDSLFPCEIEVVCGCASGADSLGERYAKEKGYEIHYFPANWDKFGRAAGPKRNLQMAQFADYAVVFWDGKSKGSKNMINCMRKLNKGAFVANI